MSAALDLTAPLHNYRVVWEIIIIMMMMMAVVMGMMSVLLADANERISAGSPRIGTGVNVLAKTSTPFFSP